MKPYLILDFKFTENCACLDNYENNNLISHEINSQNDKNTSYKRKFDGSSDGKN